jgi:hypothetical protein
MNLIDLHSELKELDFFKKFTEENECYLCAGFFVLSDEGDKAQLDFFIPSVKKIASCEFPFTCVRIHEDEILEMDELKDLENLKVDVLGLRGFVEEKSGKKFNKIIAVLQKGIWNLTCLDSMLGMVRMNVDAFSGEVLKNEKSNLMEMVRFEKGKKNSK